jgi:hypothetical protein
VLVEAGCERVWIDWDVRKKRPMRLAQRLIGR